MKKEMSPVVVAVIIVVVVAILGYWGYRKMQPEAYLPSPGVAGRPAATMPDYGHPERMGQTSSSGSAAMGGPSPMSPGGGAPMGGPSPMSPGGGGPASPGGPSPMSPGAGR